jgi:streptogramin lyase
VCWNGFIWATEENATPSGSWKHSVCKINPANGSTAATVVYDIPLELKTAIGNANGGVQADFQTEAVTTDGHLLYVSYAGHFILTVDPSTSKLVRWLEVSWANPDLSGNMYYLDGVTWAFGHIFAVSNSPLSILEIDPVTGAKLSEFKAPSGEGWGPEGLAFDGTSVYYNENTTNSCYRILLIDGYFR